MTDGGLARLLAAHAPFDALPEADRTALADAAVLQRYAPGQEVLDAFTRRTDAVLVVVEGSAAMWNTADRVDAEPDERLGPGDVFGFSAWLTQRTVGPRVVAIDETTVACIPGRAVAPAFSTERGAQFLAEQLSAANARTVSYPTYRVVDELIGRPPHLVDARTPLGEVAAAMTEHGVGYAAVPLTEGGYGLITDALLRERVIVGGLSPRTPALEAITGPARAAALGDSSDEAMIELLDAPEDILLVLDRAGVLRGVVEPLDFVASPATAGVSLREQIRRAGTVEELVQRARRLPGLLGDLLARGLASGKIIAVHSATVDAVVRRALTLVLDTHPDLAADEFTWLALGSSGRREAVLSSDVDAAVAFAEQVSDERQRAYRGAFAEVDEVLVQAGLPVDAHGTSPRLARFSRTNAQWRSAARGWLAAPEIDNGAIMTSLLVDGRPIHGDPGLPEVARVFGELREHPGTMRLLLKESLAYRARLRSVRDVVTRRSDTFDLKAHGVLPVVNIARWAALAVGSAELSTVARLHAAAGSQMLPDDQAATLIEVFESLQRVRLRRQLEQLRHDERPGDVVTLSRMSPIDRSVVAQAVRETAGVQKRMDTVAAYASADTWNDPAR